MSEHRLVIFDFCGTLIRFQTADRYVSFCLRNAPQSKSTRLRQFLVRTMEKLKLFKIYNRINKANNWHKRMILWQLKGLDYSTCDQLAQKYFEQELLPNEIAPAVQQMQAHITDGDRVCLLSGGYDIYIRHFAAHYGIQEYVSSRIEFQNGLCTGKMQGLDCMRGNKLVFFRELRKKGEHTIFYTDSISDIPLLEIVDEQIIVSHAAPQKWAEQRNYKQILWN
ncbi:MAG: HAD-IB family hydrolase [Paludibacteraceae bacterium]|nr:HAD-IB family hydrolase [Paludibacteraceae bacterium]